MNQNADILFQQSAFEGRLQNVDHFRQAVMTTSSNGSVFRVTGHLCGDFTGPRNSPVPGEFPTQRPVTRGFDVFFDLRLNKRLSKQSWGWWLETLSRPLWRYRNGLCDNYRWLQWSQS